MSARMTGMVFDYYPNGGGEFALALSIADHAHDDGTNVRPGIPTLAVKSRQSEKTVRRQLQRMQETGWLMVTQAHHGRGEKAFTEFCINPQWIVSCGVRPITEDAKQGHLTGQLDRSKCPVKAKKDDLSGQLDRSKCPVKSSEKIELFNDVLLPPLIPPTAENCDGSGGADASALLLDAQDQRLCDWILTRIRETINPQHAAPRNWNRWKRDVRLMRERDRRTHREMAELFSWANADAFWRANILSPGKLRDKWDQLVARRQSPMRGAGQAGPPVQHSRDCKAGCGAKGTRSFSTDGSEWWCEAHYEAEQLRREGVTA